MSYADLRSHLPPHSSLTRPSSSSSTSSSKFGFNKKLEKDAGAGIGNRTFLTSSPLPAPSNSSGPSVFSLGDFNRPLSTRDGSIRDQHQQPRREFSQLVLEDEFSRSIGRRICLSGEKLGTLRYFGPLHVAEGLFCGIELDEELGQHDGFIDGRRYFKAQPRRGIFAPVEKVRIVKDNLHSALADRRPFSGVIAGSMPSLDRNTALDNTFVILNDGVQETGEEFLVKSRTSSDEFSDELITEVEPHLMSFSMLDDADMLSENEQKLTVPRTGANQNLASSFELSDSLLFLKQSRFPGFDVSMTGSQLAALMITDDGADENEPNVAQKALFVAERQRFDDKFVESVGGVAKKASFVDGLPSADFDELPTPVCAEAAQLFESYDVEDHSKKPQTFFAAPFFLAEKQQSFSDDAVGADLSTAANKSVATISSKETSCVLRQQTKNAKERPVSTISADTGYQGDTEYETQSGRSSSPPEVDEFEKENLKKSGQMSSELTSSNRTERETASIETQTDADLCLIGAKTDLKRPDAIDFDADISYVETIYRDKAGNVVKIVRGEAAPPLQSTENASVPAGDSHKTEGQGPKISSPKKDSQNSSKSLTTGKTTASPKHKPLKQESLTRNKTEDLSYQIKKIGGPDEENNKDKEESGTVKGKAALKEPEPAFKKPRPPPKLSKHAEIMAKLQQSIAQDKNKPKKDIKSKYFSAVEAAKSDEHALHPGGSRSQSRAGSTVPSAQMSPVDGAPEKNEQRISPVDSVATAASSEANGVQNGLNKRLSTTSDQSKPGGKSLLSKRENSNLENKKLSETLPTNKRLSTAKAAPTASSRQKTLPPRPSGKFPAKATSKIQESEQKNILPMVNQVLSKNARGFEAACVVVQHFTDYILPRLERKFIETKGDLEGSLKVIDKLDAEKTSLSAEFESLQALHDAELENLKKEHDEASKRLEKKLAREHEKKTYDLRDQHEQEVRRIMDDYVIKEQLLTKRAENLCEDEIKQCQQKIASLVEQQEKESQELKQNFTKENEDLKQQFELWKASISEKLKESKNACERYKNEARELEASLMKDAEKKMQDVNERFAVYKQEIDSLHVVLDMKNTEIHELRVKCQVLEKDLERYHQLKTKVAVLEQKNVELREALELKKVAERRLSQKHLELQQTCEREKDRVQRLSMTNEQLQYRLQHVMMSQSAYETPLSRFPSGDSPDSSADFSLRDKPMSQSLIHIYANNSPRSSHHQVPVTVYTSDGVSKALCFEKTGSDGSHSNKRRSASERSNMAADTSPYIPSSSLMQAKNIDKRSSSAPNKRRISPLGHHHGSGSSGFGGVGLPGVETVAEVCESNCHSSDCGTSAGSSEGSGGCPKMCKTQANGCFLADSGVFTSSFHCEAADRPSSQSESDVFPANELNSSAEVSTPKSSFSNSQTPQQ